MLRSVAIVNETGLKIEGKKLWKEAGVQLNSARLKVYIIGKNARLE